MATLAIVHDAITDDSSIGSIAAWDAREALGRGWDVLAVTRKLAPDLAGSVTQLPLYVPPRVHLVQYAAGRTAVRTALRGHSPDVIVTHQPQTAAIADIWNAHYLERAARETIGPFAAGMRGRMDAVLSAGVAVFEDHYLGALTAKTRVLFCSEALRSDFVRLYGPPPSAHVLPNPAPGRADPISGPDLAARKALVGDHVGPVVGFLGGGDRRKGGDLLVDAVGREPDLFLLHAGPSPLGASGARMRAMGHLTDVRALLDVVDALIVPSRFEPFGLVAVEAAARGVPVLVAPAVGCAPLVLEHDAGQVWNGVSELTPLVRDLISHRARYASGGARLAATLDRSTIADLRFEEIELACDARAKRSR